MGLFDNWYDYLNPVEYLKYGKQELFDKPANNAKTAYDQAVSSSQANQKQLMDFYDKRRGEALGLYAPLQKMFANTYGQNPGIAPPQVPQVPGSQPLNKMFGGR